MRAAGVSSRSLLSLARAARTPVGGARPLLLLGVMVDTLERELAAGGDGTALSRGVDPTGAAAVVLVVGGEPTESDLDTLRRATRAGVPIIAVQLDPRSTSEIPYVLATHVVTCLPGQPLPVSEIATEIASCLRWDDAALAARLPILYEPFMRRTIGRSAARAVAIGALPWFPAEQFPVIAMEQLRMSQQVAAARGQASSLPLPPELGIVVGAGLALRTAARRISVGRVRSEWVVRAGVAALGTVLIGAVAARRPD